MEWSSHTVESRQHTSDGDDEKDQESPDHSVQSEHSELPQDHAPTKDAYEQTGHDDDVRSKEAVSDSRTYPRDQSVDGSEYSRDIKDDDSGNYLQHHQLLVNKAALVAMWMNMWMKVSLETVETRIQHIIKVMMNQRSLPKVRKTFRL